MAAAASAVGTFTPSAGGEAWLQRTLAFMLGTKVAAEAWEGIAPHPRTTLVTRDTDPASGRPRNIELLTEHARRCLPTGSTKQFAVDFNDCAGKWSTPDTLMVAYVRPAGSRNAVLFPLQHYQTPRSSPPRSAWETKKDALVWRGASTGLGSRIEFLRRVRHLHGDAPDLDLGLTQIVQRPPADAAEYQKPYMSHLELFSHRYVLVLEGNDVGSLMGDALRSDCVPLAPYPLTYETMQFCGLEPWVHFVPVAHDATDLRERLDWCRAHAAECAAIVAAGQAHMAPFDDLRLFDELLRRWMEAYAFHVSASAVDTALTAPPCA